MVQQKLPYSRVITSGPLKSRSQNLYHNASVKLLNRSMMLKAPFVYQDHVATRVLTDPHRKSSPVSRTTDVAILNEGPGLKTCMCHREARTSRML